MNTILTAALRIRLLLSLVGLCLLPSMVRAQVQVATFRSTKLQFFQINYSGEKDKSLAGGDSGVGVEAYGDVGRSWGRFYTKVRGTQSAGSQTFIDGSSTPTCSYTLYQGQFETGVVLFPVPPREPGLGLFFSAGGTLGYNWLSLTSSSTLTNLKPSESATSFGYTAGVGVEWALTKTPGKRNVLTGEITYRSEKANLAAQSGFDLSGLAIHVGYGW